MFFRFPEILCLLFSMMVSKVHNTLRYNNLSLLEKFRTFFTSSSCRLPLETGQLDTL